MGVAARPIGRPGGEGGGMNNLNSVLLEGNLVRDPEVRDVKEGIRVCRFRIGVNRSRRTSSGEWEEESTFVDIETWRRIADYCSQKLKKGMQVRIVGRIRQETWTDKEGASRSRLVVIADHVEYRPDAKASAKSIDEEEDPEDAEKEAIAF